MDTEKELMEQLHKLQEQNKELLAGANVLNARNRELVKFVKDVLKDTFNNEIGRVDFEKERVAKTNKVIAESYKTFSGQIHRFSEVAKNIRGDKSPEITHMVWDKLKEFVSEQSKDAAKEGQKAIARGVKKANKQIKEAEEMYKELNEKFETVNS